MQRDFNIDPKGILDLKTPENYRNHICLAKFQVIWLQPPQVNQRSILVKKMLAKISPTQTIPDILTFQLASK